MRMNEQAPRSSGQILKGMKPQPNWRRVPDVTFPEDRTPEELERCEEIASKTKELRQK